METDAQLIQETVRRVQQEGRIPLLLRISPGIWQEMCSEFQPEKWYAVHTKPSPLFRGTVTGDTFLGIAVDYTSGQPHVLCADGEQFAIRTRAV